MKIALAQINPTVGDLEGNLQKIQAFHARAAAAGAALVVFPELAVTGYPPLDLVSHGSFVAQADGAVDRLASVLTGPPALVGCILPNPESAGRPVINAAVLIREGTRVSTHAKSRLPTYDVFDEDRYFEPAARVQPFELGGLRVGVTVCEDIWSGPEDDRPRYRGDPVEELGRQGVDLLVNLSASPFHAGKSRARERRLQEIAADLGCPVALVNQVGGNDSLLFDGRSLAVGPGNRLLARGAAFDEEVESRVTSIQGEMTHRSHGDHAGQCRHAFQELRKERRLRLGFRIFRRGQRDGRFESSSGAEAGVDLE